MARSLSYSLMFAGVALFACGPTVSVPTGDTDAGTQDAGQRTYTNEATGTITGESLTVADAVAGTTSSAGGAGIIIVNSAGYCSRATSNVQAKGEARLILLLDKSDNSTVSPGTYTVGASGGNGATAIFSKLDQLCDPVSGKGGTATAGTVTIAAISLTDGGKTTGSFDLSFGSDHVTGSFNAPFCTGQTSSTLACE